MTTPKPPLVRLGPGGDYVYDYDPEPGAPIHLVAHAVGWLCGGLGCVTVGLIVWLMIPGAKP